jgi:hypothetical protein
MRLFPLVLAGLALTACARPAPLGPQPVAEHLGPQLTAADIQSQIVGNTGRGSRTGTTSEFAMYVAPDGRLVSQSIAGRAVGHWRISGDDRFCTTGAVVTRGGEVCQTVHKAGIGVQLASPQSVEEMVFAPGGSL